MWQRLSLPASLDNPKAKRKPNILAERECQSTNPVPGDETALLELADTQVANSKLRTTFPRNSRSAFWPTASRAASAYSVGTLSANLRSFSFAA